jgi:hypothetical protein
MPDSILPFAWLCKAGTGTQPLAGSPSTAATLHTHRALGAMFTLSQIGVVEIIRNQAGHNSKEVAGPKVVGLHLG